MPMPARSAKAVRLASISGRDGKSDEPSMNSAWMPRSSGSRARGEFQSQRSKAREVRSAGAYGLVHDRRRWKNGQWRNIPPGPGSAEMTAWPIPKRDRKYDVWSAPGPEPTTTTGYSPGGNGRSPGAEPSATGGFAVIRSAPAVGVPEPTGGGLEHAVHDPGVL